MNWRLGMAGCWLLSGLLFAQGRRELMLPSNDLFHRGWTAEDGLPNDRIFKIAQSPEGYLWLGTEGGLTRFDGIKALRVSQAPRGLEDFLIYAEPDGTMWLSRFRGKTSGLFRYRGGKFEAVPLPPVPGRAPGAKSTVLTVMRDRDKALWVGFFFGGLMRVGADGVTKAFGASEGFPAVTKTVTSIVQDTRGVIWVATAGAGVFSYQNGHFTQYAGMSDDRVYTLAIDREGAVWAGTSRGVSVIREGKATPLVLDKRYRFDLVNAVMCDRDGAMWIATDGRGLFRYRDGKVTQFDETTGLTNNVVRTVSQDREGNIWAGTRGGLDRFSQAAFSTMTTANGLPTNSFGPIVRDRNGDVWMAPLAGGLYRIHQGQLEDLHDLVQGDKVLALAECSTGGLWLGRLAGGLSLLRDGKLQSWGVKEGLPAAEVDNLHEDRHGNVWLGIWNQGVVKWSQGKIQSLDWKNKHPGTVLVQGFAESSNGDVWVADGVAGLIRIRGGETRVFGTADGLPEGSVTAVFVDRQDRVWVAGSGGLSRQVGSRFVTIGPENGLPLGAVGEMYSDGSGGFWLAGGGGIYRADQRELDQFFGGKPVRVHLVKYGTSDGLVGTSATKFSHPIILPMPDRKLWISSSRGIAVTDPSRLLETHSKPDVVIEQVSTDLDTFEHAENLQLCAGTTRLQIHFTGLLLAAPESLHFRYRLEGFDKGWVDSGTNRMAEYTNLRPGRYTFRVAAASGSGDWGPASNPLAVEMRPHFYETGWFGLCCVVAVGLVIAAAYLWRMRQMRSRFDLVLNERIRIAREVHDTLLQGFAGIAWQLDAVSRSMLAKPAESKVQMDHLLVQMDQCLAEARQAISAMRLPGKPERRLEEMIQLTGQQLAAGAGLKFQVETSGGVRALPRDLEESLFCVAREAIVNAISHANARSVTVSLAFRRQEIKLTITDDGQGFDPRLALPANGHWGLTGMRERVAQFGGDLVVESRPGQGTEIRATVPTEDGTDRTRPAREADSVQAGD